MVTKEQDNLLFPGGQKPQRLKTGIEGLDRLIEGGLLEKRSYLICGPPGSGKTTFGTHFLIEGEKNDEKGLYLSLMEETENVYHDMSRFFDLDKYIANKNLFFRDYASDEPYDFEGTMRLIGQDGVPTAAIDRVVKTPTPVKVFTGLKNIIERFAVKRLVIDSVSAIKFATYDYQGKEKELSRFIKNIKKTGCTTLMLSELTDPSKYSVEHYVTSGVIFLHNYMEKQKMTRKLQIIKMRGTRHDCDMRPIDFTVKGLRVSTAVVE